MSKTSVARKAKVRSRIRKEKTVEVDGHQLTAEMYLLYGRYLESRESTNRHDPPAYREKLALGDLLSKYRISCTSKEQLQVLSAELMDVRLALANLAAFPFFSGQDRRTRLAGCDALNRLSESLYVAGKKVAAISHAIRYEANGSKVQEWIENQNAIDNVSWPPSHAEGQS